jgi:FkbM family methyltransferase
MKKKLKRKIENILVEYLPSWALALGGYLVGLTFFSISRSQYGEDLIIEQYFRQRFGDDFQGTYLDIGAFHPVWLSNTHRLHKRGWTGHVIDVERRKLAAFKVARGNRVTTHFTAITAGEVSAVKIYKFKRIWSEIDTIDYETAVASKEKSGFQFHEEAVPASTLHFILEKITSVDFINIDIEGLDSQILDQLDLTIHKPALIVFEDNTSWGGGKKTAEKLTAHGYVRIFISGGSVGYGLPISENAA